MKSHLTLRVRYAETDKMGRVYHANYLIYLDLARTEFLRERGFSYADMEKNGLYFVVADAQAEYIHPLEFDDQFTITTTLVESKKVSLTFSYVIICQGREVFHGRTRLAAVSPEGKIIRIPDEIIRKIS